PVPTGLPQQQSTLNLPGGLNIPINLPAVTADQSITLTVPDSVHVQGTVRDSKGNPLPYFTVSLTPTESGRSTSVTQADANGHYGLNVLAGSYRFNASCSSRCGNYPAYLYAGFKTVVDVDHDLTHDLSIALSTLTVSIRDADGSPVANASFGYSGYTNQADYDVYTSGSAATDNTGNTSFPVPTGLPQQQSTLNLPGGLNIPINLPAVTADQRLFFIFDRTTGTLYLDDQPPVVVGIPDREANAAGWYNAPVAITWKSIDPRPSSGTPTRPPAQTIGTEGADQPVTSEESCDPAGNCATGSYRVSIDRTDPGLDVTMSEPPNLKRWHKTPVTLTFNCVDALSGVATCPEPVTVSEDGANQEITATAVDGAGNSRTKTVKVNIDTTAPTVTAKVSQASNESGWNNGDVTITFTCADNLSGVATCPEPVTLTEEGADQTVIGTAIDQAGNSTTTTVTVSIDKTQPLIFATRTATNTYGWNNDDVIVSFTCSDDLSGIASCPEPLTIAEEGPDQSVSGTALNHAGLAATAEVAGINIDRTAPNINATITGTKNDSGWYQQPPTVHYTCADALAGIATCPTDSTITSEGANQELTGTATDKAGNSTSTSTGGLNIDYTPPIVTINGAANGATYPLDQLPTVTCATTDTGSGVATDAVLAIARNNAGKYTASCNSATDNAGNRAPTVSITYTVTPTTDSMAALTAAYVSGSGSSNVQGVTQDLSNKLEHGQLCQYVLKVNKEVTGDNPTLTPAQATELTYWARILGSTC
ncbi:carboxypeptidase-like regulatory domain-containing protein, partial [Micromonospora purpureochromogenes]|uniref:carboxypeptidase-like regulatory domain-containing protein n=1 Tax=Micromonospora purpureochromogenes TaxID=47872 RepID=UPI0033FF8725